MRRIFTPNSALGTLALGALALLAGCQSYDPEVVDDVEVVLNDYEAVRAMAPQGPAFNQGLRQGYLDYGDLQYEGSDYQDFIHFAYKAVDSARGERVLPDTVESRTLPAASVDELTIAKARLMGALDQGGRQQAPYEAATAQTAFDCWIERTEDQNDPAAIEACKGRFGQAIAELEQELTRDVGNVHLVFFAWDQAVLTSVAETVLDQVADDLGEGGRLTIGGHAESTGSDAYNDNLSKRRAEIVARALAARGIDEERLEVEWFGERRPRVVRPDATREPQIRRVEITPG
jgi:OOP family OmpA-OmpF porin